LIINVKISFAEFLIFGYTLRERKEKPLPVRFCRAVKLRGRRKTEYRIIQRFSEEPEDKADAMAGRDGSRRTVLASAAGMRRSCIFQVRTEEKFLGKKLTFYIYSLWFWYDNDRRNKSKILGFGSFSFQ
jgi:hypothetical protein